MVAIVVVAGFIAYREGAQDKVAPSSAATANCTVSAILVNSCHPWIGGEASNYGGIAENPKDQILGHESRVGRQLQMVHTYHRPGTNSLNSSDLYFINRPNTILEADWIPGGGSFAAAGSPSDNGNIDKMAASIKAVAPKKIIFSIWHEPENDASTGMSPCTPSGKGHAGSPAEFAAMYRYIHDRMVADGVTNVVWAINYMGAANWDKCINQYWPGNSYVDWIFWDPYAHSGSFSSMAGRFYNFLTANTDASHAYTSKAWGLAEWNIYWSGMTRQQQIDLYNSAATTIDGNTLPRLKAFEVFDSLDQSVASFPGSNKTKNPPVIDSGLLAAYKNFALDPRFNDSYYTGSGGGGGGGGGDITAPNVSITSPANGATVSGSIAVNVSASDDVHVSKVVISVDGKVLATDTASPYSASFVTTGYANGNHTVTATAYDAAGNNKTAQVGVTVQNSSVQPTADKTSPGATITSPTVNAKLSGSVMLAANATDNVGVAKVVFSIDGATVGIDTTPPYSMTLNTLAYANGSHTIRAQAVDAAGNHRTPLVTVAVSNAGTPPNPTITSFKASPALVTVGGVSTLSWSSANAVNCSVSPGGPQKTLLTTWTTAAYTSASVKTYTLTCANAAGKAVTATTRVTVNPAPSAPGKPVFTADKTTVGAGGNALLSWSASGASSCVLAPGNVTSSGGTGSKLVSGIKATTTYTITCSNSAGKSASSLQITVSPAPPVTTPAITLFTATPSALTAGGTSTLQWATTNVADNGCTLQPGVLSSVAASGSWQTPALKSSTSYTLTCKDSAGSVVSKSLGITVNGVPAPVAPRSSATSTSPVTSPTVTALGGQKVVNAQEQDKVGQGQLVTLDPSNVTDQTKVTNIARVEYYDGEKLVATVSEPPYALNTKNMKPGLYSITERTYYTDGSMSERTQDITVAATNAASKSHASVLPIVLSVVGLAAIAAVAVFLVRRRVLRRALVNHGWTPGSGPQYPESPAGDEHWPQGPPMVG